MKQRLYNLPRRISRPNGRKAIARLRHDLNVLIDRAPDSFVSTWPMDARQAAFKLFAVLERMYADRGER